MTFFRFLVTILVVGLGACSSEKFEGVDGFDFVKSIVQNKLAAKNQSPPENPLATLTRSQLAGVSGPFILAHLEVNNAYSSLSAIGKNGDAITFLTPDQISLVLENGVLVATRGLGGDLLSTDASGMQSRLKNKNSEPFKRVHRSLDAEDHIVIESFDCTLQKTAAEKIEVVENVYVVDVHIERCKNEAFAFQNTYWVTQKERTIIHSRQWVSSSIQYIDLWVLIE